MGDDIPDIPVMKKVAEATYPQDAAVDEENIGLPVSFGMRKKGVYVISLNRYWGCRINGWKKKRTVMVNRNNSTVTAEDKPYPDEKSIDQSDKKYFRTESYHLA